MSKKLKYWQVASPKI